MKRIISGPPDELRCCIYTDHAAADQDDLEEIMRAVFALCGVLGLAGIVIGVLTILRHSAGPNGVPFTFENYGGPGPLIAGVLVLAVSLYLLSIWPSRD
jgi:hypothetical protein